MARILARFWRRRPGETADNISASRAISSEATSRYFDNTASYLLSSCQNESGGLIDRLDIQ